MTIDTLEIAGILEVVLAKYLRLPAGMATAIAKDGAQAIAAAVADANDEDDWLDDGDSPPCDDIVDGCVRFFGWEVATLRSGVPHSILDRFEQAICGPRGWR